MLLHCSHETMEVPFQVCQQGELKGYYLNLVRTKSSSVHGTRKRLVLQCVRICMHLYATVYVLAYILKAGGINLIV